MAGSFAPILPQKALKTSRFPAFFESSWNKIPLPKCGTYFSAITYIKKNGLPDFISFDNDLGLDKHGVVALDGYAAAKWLVYESGLDLINLKFKVHSANPVAAEQIRGLLNNYQKYLRNSK